MSRSFLATKVSSACTIMKLADDASSKVIVQQTTQYVSKSLSMAYRPIRERLHGVNWRRAESDGAFGYLIISEHDESCLYASAIASQS